MAAPVSEEIVVVEGVDNSYVLYMIYNILAVKESILLSFASAFD
jgi:hypothetical protein